MEMPVNIDASFEKLKVAANTAIKKGIDEISLLDLLAGEYVNILRQALDEYAQKNPRELDGLRDEAHVDDKICRCPNCGAPDEFSQERAGENHWLGLGEGETCKLCGAEAVHKLRLPLREIRLGWLLQELNDIQLAYERHIVAELDGRMNRAYFRRILSAILSKAHDVKSLWPDREVAAEYKRKCGYAVDLVGKVYSGKIAQYYLEEGLPVAGMVELNQFIAELESEYQAKLASIKTQAT